MHSSFGRERLILMDPTDSRLGRTVTAWDRIVAALTNPELIAIAILCVLGLAVTLGFCFLFPSFGEIAALPAI
jgi:hypothetical protein